MKPSETGAGVSHKLLRRSEELVSLRKLSESTWREMSVLRAAKKLAMSGNISGGAFPAEIDYYSANILSVIQSVIFP